MLSAVKIEKMVCPTCNRRLFDKEEGAMGTFADKFWVVF